MKSPISEMFQQIYFHHLALFLLHNIIKGWAVILTQKLLQKSPIKCSVVSSLINQSSIKLFAFGDQSNSLLIHNGEFLNFKESRDVNKTFA